MTFEPDDDRHRRGAEFPSRGRALDAGTVDDADTQRAKARAPDSSPPVLWRSSQEIFAPLPPTNWLVRGLQLGPGRPGLLAAEGGAGKTMVAQSLGLAVAAGVPAWGRVETKLGVVRHFDYEQGFAATARRYQRLAVGAGIGLADLGERLHLAVLPSLFLDSPNAIGSYARACEGADLVILDSLRAATPTQDENDSSIRTCIDNLTRLSELTGATFLLLHHAGKTKTGRDSGAAVRGSSAIIDSCGCILEMTYARGNSGQRLIRQRKPPADAEDRGIAEFALVFEDVTVGTGEVGVRVLYAPLGGPPQRRDVTEEAHSEDKQAEFRESLLRAVRMHPDFDQGEIISATGLQRTSANRILRTMVNEGVLRVDKGPHGAFFYSVVDS